MHASHLVEIAGVLGLTAGPVVSRGTPLPTDALAEYWIASRCRLDHWGRSLRCLGHSHLAPQQQGRGDLLVRLVEEITLSDVLTRLVAGVTVVSDRANPSGEAAMIGSNALEGHREAARRLRSLVVAWWPADSERADHARGLARRSRVWSDVLLSRLGESAGFSKLIHDHERFNEARRDVLGENASEATVVNRLTQVALRHAFEHATAAPLAPDLNRRIATAALGLIDSAAFDGHGLPRAAWMLRAERTIEETAGLLQFATDDHLQSDPQSIPPARWWV